MDNLQGAVSQSEPIATPTRYWSAQFLMASHLITSVVSDTALTHSILRLSRRGRMSSVELARQPSMLGRHVAHMAISLTAGIPKSDVIMEAGGAVHATEMHHDVTALNAR